MYILNTLLEITIYSGVIFTATMLLKTLLKSKMSPLLHYAVWLALVLRLVMPFTIASPVRLFVIPSGAQSAASTQAGSLSYEPAVTPDITGTDATDARPQPQAASLAVQSESLSAAPAVQTPEGLPWQQVVTIIWLAGAGGGFVYLAVLYTAMRRRFRASASAPSARLLALFEDTKAEVGVNSDIKLTCPYDYGAPSLMFPKTIIMPAGAILAMNDEQIAFALRHELTHYKRRDHIICMLLAALGIVYWFNPFVWAALRYIRADMETACDASVVKRLSAEGKRRYASLIVSLFARPARGRLVLGMAQPNVRKAAERRVKGIFMKDDSKTGAKLVSALLAAVLLLTCFTTACQPTPAKPAIINKNDGKLEQILHATPQPPAAYKAAGRWNETTKNDKLKIVIDTDVYMPDVTEYPVVKLERATFTQQRVDGLVNYFAQGKQLHLPHILTKADYEQWIVVAKRGDLTDGKYVVTQDSLDYVKFLEEKQAAAPDDSPVINTDTTLTYERDEKGNDITESGKNHLRVAFDNGSGRDAIISIDNYTPGYSSFTSFSYNAGKNPPAITRSMYQDMLDTGVTEEESGWTGAGELFDNVEITREQAVAKADEVISGLGIAHVMLVNAEKYVTPDAPESGGYELVYSRESGGLPLYWLDGGSWFGGEQPAAYTPPFNEEVLTANVSKDGLVSLFWRGYADVVETVNKNVSLLPFENIQQMLKDLIFYKKSFMQGDKYCDLTVTVTSAGLRTGYIGVKDIPDQALMVPAWVFETRISYYDTASGTQLDYKDDTYMLSAIDGGVIEYRREPKEYIDAEG